MQHRTGLGRFRNSSSTRMQCLKRRPPKVTLSPLRPLSSSIHLPLVQQNKILESKIQRRLSRIVIKKKKSAGLLNNNPVNTSSLAPPADAFLGTSAVLGGSLGSSLGMFPSSLGPSSSHGPPLFLRIRIADTADAGHVSTTIQTYVPFV